MTDRIQKETKVPYWDLSPRRIIQLLGTESVRDVFGLDTWVKRAQLSVEMLLECEKLEPLASDALIFTDTRFDNEAQWIKRSGGIIIEIVRPGLAGVEAHRSEQGLPPELVDAVLLNDGTLDDLRVKVATRAAEWLRCAEHMVTHGRAA